MKKILLGLFTLATMGAVNAQIEIQQDGTGPDVSGTIVNINVDQFTPTPYTPKFYVTNNTGANAQWQVTRVKQNVPTTWIDQICWPPSCFSASGEVYTTPSSAGNPAPVIVNGTYQTTDGATAELKAQITPDGSNGVGLYMYYITDNNGNYVDSIGVQINFALGVEEAKPSISVSVAPNPANSYVKISTEGAQAGSVKVMDVLGNIVLSEKMNGSTKTINTNAFRNGIYFIRIEADGVQTVNKKIIVKH